MNYNFRLAVSPVAGNFKLGPLRTHIYNYMMALSLRKDGHNVNIFLRKDDTNPKKHKNNLFPKLYSLLTNEFNMSFDPIPGSREPFLSQSKRTSIYEAYLSKLVESNFATINEDGSAILNLEAYQEKFGNIVKIRKTKFDTNSLFTDNKFYLRRSDRSYLYQFASTVDDIELGITHVIRGNNTLSTAPNQEMLVNILGGQKKNYVHLPLLFGGGNYLDYLKEGVSKEALIFFIISSASPNMFDALSSVTIEASSSLFKASKISRKDSTIDTKKLYFINKKLMRILDDSSYLNSFQRYRALNKEAPVELKEHLDIILKNRTSFKKGSDQLNSMSNPNYPDLSSNEYSQLFSILKELCSIPDSSIKDAILKITGKDIQLLNMVLTGNYHSFPIADIIDTLKINEIKHRIDQTFDALSR